MAKFTYYLAPSDKLDLIEYKVGNLIFVDDLHRIYLDGISGRVSYDAIKVFATDAERIAYENPLEGFYFVEDTKCLWRYYESTWSAITAPPSGSVIFIPKSDLPPEGQTDVLYVCDTEMFVWDENQHLYASVGGDVVWQEV